MKVGILLFNDFESLDVFGPVEILGRLQDLYTITFHSLKGGVIRNSHGVSIITESLDELGDKTDIFLIPGGYGTRVEVNNSLLVEKIKEISLKSQFVFTVCTGTALLARTGLLDGRRATTNKRAFGWVCTQGPNVDWVKQARWVIDGKFYTSSGVSAGMDMTLGFLQDQHGIEFARNVAFQIEYTWQEDPHNDPFCNQ